MRKCKTEGCEGNPESILAFCNKCLGDKLVDYRAGRTDEQIAEDDRQNEVEQQDNDMPGGFW